MLRAILQTTLGTMLRTTTGREVRRVRMTVVLRTIGNLTVVLLTTVQRGNLVLRQARHVRRNRSVNRLRDRPRSAVKALRLRRSGTRTHQRRPSATRTPHVTRVTLARDGKARQRMFRWPVLGISTGHYFLELCGDSRPRLSGGAKLRWLSAVGNAID